MTSPFRFHRFSAAFTILVPFSGSWGSLKVNRKRCFLVLSVSCLKVSSPCCFIITVIISLPFSQTHSYRQSSSLLSTKQPAKYQRYCVCVCEKYTVCLFLTTCRLVRETSQHLALGRQSRRGRGLGADIFLAQNDTRLWPSPPHSPVGGRGKTSFANCVNDEFNLCLTESGKGRESS